MHADGGCHSLHNSDLELPSCRAARKPTGALEAKPPVLNAAAMFKCLKGGTAQDMADQSGGACVTCEGGLTQLACSPLQVSYVSVQSRICAEAPAYTVVLC